MASCAQPSEAQLYQETLTIHTIWPQEKLNRCCWMSLVQEVEFHTQSLRCDPDLRQYATAHPEYRNGRILSHLDLMDVLVNLVPLACYQAPR